MYCWYIQRQITENLYNLHNKFISFKHILFWFTLLCNAIIYAIWSIVLAPHTYGLVNGAIRFSVKN